MQSLLTVMEDKMADEVNKLNEEINDEEEEDKE